MIDGDWKLVHNSPFRPLELFNLREDPGETRNLAGRAGRKRKLDELTRALAAAHAGGRRRTLAEGSVMIQGFPASTALSMSLTAATFSRPKPHWGFGI